MIHRVAGPAAVLVRSLEVISKKHSMKTWLKALTPSTISAATIVTSRSSRRSFSNKSNTASNQIQKFSHRDEVNIIE